MTNSERPLPAARSLPPPSIRLRRVLSHDPAATALLFNGRRHPWGYYADAVLQAGLPRDTFASVRAVGSGTAPVPPELSEAFSRQYGVPVLVRYGATEFAGAIAGWSLQDYRLFWTDKRGSVGRVHPGVELRVTDPDSGAPLPPAAVGTLEVSGRQLATSDGLPDERLGEVPAAAVTLRGAATERGLLDYLATRLTRYQLPVLIRVLDEPPRTPSMKVNRPLLREIVLASGDPASEEVPSGG
jgi:acyl-CoA synthetase (AMP-forming)/AMP-acid ligase II